MFKILLNYNISYIGPLDFLQGSYLLQSIFGYFLAFLPTKISVRDEAYFYVERISKNAFYGGSRISGLFTNNSYILIRKNIAWCGTWVEGITGFLLPVNSGRYYEII